MTSILIFVLVVGGFGLLLCIATIREELQRKPRLKLPPEYTHSQYLNK